MKNLRNTLALALALTATATFAAPSVGDTMQDQARQYACADVSTGSNDACLASMFAEVHRTEKALLKKPSVESAIAFDVAVGTFNGALAVAPRTAAVADLENHYKALLKEVADAQGKSLPRYDGLK